MREVVLSKRASEKLENLLNYLETQWSEKLKQNFIIKFDDSVKAISLFLESTEKSDLKKGLHRFFSNNSPLPIQRTLWGGRSRGTFRAHFQRCANTRSFCTPNSFCQSY